MNELEMAELEASIEQMTAIATRDGLDFYPMRFEVCPADILYTFGAYGMPTRFSHWSFGKAWHRMKLDYDFGLSRIYELVINSDPCYAFLLDGNTLLQNKTVSAHVLAHCDFFKNNAAFAATSRDMVDRMAASADRIRRYELEHGRDRVETVLNAGMALMEHVDATLRSRRLRAARDPRAPASPAPQRTPVKRASEYDDLWRLDALAAVDNADDSDRSAKRAPVLEGMDRDLMLFLVDQSNALEEWERDILSILREEMLYFWPQLETKIMNEGWATYWHLRIMRELDLSDGEAVEFAKMHSSVVLPSRVTLNPYHLGLALWEDIEKRWDAPSEEDRERFHREPGQGRGKMFEIRQTETDVSFVRNYLTQDLVEKLDLYLYQKVGNEWRVVETDWKKVRDAICSARVNGGIPVMEVVDGDYSGNGELMIRHAYEGVELDLKHVEKVMLYLYQLWGRNTHLQTVVEGREVLFTCDGKRTTRKFL